MAFQAGCKSQKLFHPLISHGSHKYWKVHLWSVPWDAKRTGCLRTDSVIESCVENCKRPSRMLQIDAQVQVVDFLVVKSCSVASRQGWRNVLLKLRICYTFVAGAVPLQWEREGVCGSVRCFEDWRESLDDLWLLFWNRLLISISFFNTSFMVGLSSGMSRVHIKASPITMAIRCWWEGRSGKSRGSSTCRRLFDSDTVFLIHAGRFGVTFTLSSGRLPDSISSSIIP